MISDNPAQDPLLALIYIIAVFIWIGYLMRKQDDGSKR